MLQINSSELCFYKMCKTRLVKILIAAANQIEFRTFKIIQTTGMHITMIKKQQQQKMVEMQSMLPEVSGALRFKVLYFRAPIAALMSQACRSGLLWGVL